MKGLALTSELYLRKKEISPRPQTGGKKGSPIFPSATSYAFSSLTKKG